MPTQNVSMSNEVYDLVRKRQSERGGTFSGALDNLVKLAYAHLEEIANYPEERGEDEDAYAE